MPTSTFYNLPEEKKEKLINAIKDELSRVSFSEVSINKIVQGAEIPRGSFYQYFTDKKDMLVFILEKYKSQMLWHVKNSLIKNNGDIFAMVYEVLIFTVDFTLKNKDNSFCRNLFSDVRINTEFYLKLPGHSNKSDTIKELYPYVNCEMLDLRDESDFDNMLEVLFSVGRDTLAEMFLNLSEHEKIKQNYKNKLELIKRGFTKKQT